ncbi:hypothetical protein [Roseibium aggregatum]|uniref:hypothetical protein n=1 Tax=Roseibium aggregatum TaxID=187304 RepID=UPI001E4D346C|nr:hypothetical protein [Roseibium aggregatum]UES51335.1 hypothetical protein GFK88_17985 [Roseibium aggregatum]
MTSALPPTPSVSPQSAKAPQKQPSETESRFLQFRSILAEQYAEWRELPEEERIRHKYLEDHGLTELGLDNLSPRNRAVHEEKIAEMTKQPVVSPTPYRGADAGDALSRPVITLQSVLDVHDASQEAEAAEATADSKA